VLAKTDVPGAIRPGELARISWPRASRAPLPLPGECSDGAAALEAVDDLRTRLRASAPGVCLRTTGKTDCPP
jgi:hypothetical protein